MNVEKNCSSFFSSFQRSVEDVTFLFSVKKIIKQLKSEPKNDTHTKTLVYQLDQSFYNHIVFKVNIYMYHNHYIFLTKVDLSFTTISPDDKL